MPDWVQNLINTVQTMLTGQQLSLGLLVLVFALGLVAGLTPYGLTTAVVLARRAGTTGSSTTGLRTATWFSIGAAASLLAVGVFAAAAGQALLDLELARWVPLITLLIGLQLLGVLRIPRRWRRSRPADLPDQQRGQSPAVSFALGVPFGVIAAPCTAPMVITVLSLVAMNGSQVFAAAVLTAFAVGRSVPLLAVGAAGPALATRLRPMPGLGAFRKVLGAILIAASAYFLTFGAIHFAS